jgi:hypothetical protein
LQAQVNVFEAGMMIHSGFFFGGTAVKASGTAQDVRWTSALRGPEWNGDAAARCRRQRSKGIGKFPQQAENRFRVTKALLAN